MTIYEYLTIKKVEWDSQGGTSVNLFYRFLTKDLEVLERKNITIGQITLDRKRILLFVDNKPVSITKREYNLLQYLMMNKGRVVKREEALNNVWGSNNFYNSRVLDVTVGYLRGKIGNGFIKTVRGFGYIINDKVSR